MMRTSNLTCKTTSVEWRRVPLPASYRAISDLLREVYDEKLEKLKSMKLIPDLVIVPKKLLLDLREQLVAKAPEKSVRLHLRSPNPPITSNLNSPRNRTPRDSRRRELESLP